MEKKVSMIIPVYNAQRFINACLTSVCAQTYSNLEIIVVDDKSTDDSLRIIKELAKRDARIHVHCNQENMGVSITRNRALRLAEGDYVQFVDSDDVVAPAITEKLVQALERYESDLAICNANMLIYKDEILESSSPLCLPIEYGECAVSQYAFLSRFGYNMYQNVICVGVLWNKLYKRSILLKSKAHFPEGLSYAEDLIFNTQVYRYLSRVTLIDDVLYDYHVRTGFSLVQGYKAENLMVHVLLGNAMRDLLNAFGLYVGENRANMHNWLSNNMVESLFELFLPSCPLNDAQKLAEISRAIEEDIIDDAFTYATERNAMYDPFVTLFLKKDAHGLLEEADKCYHEHLDLFER